uniref:ATP synthase F0 subunit 8 n=1 Tax=Neodiprion huizeensis TaxID=2980995 RepID=UPI0023F59266|nr:ATP synthase F0 subunit 8 [Neodiprion huizeensis]WDY84630.1 ATP synthase F0 subunit 8 [Neodiprion huizeensis]
MPQMYPMNWLFLFMFFTLLFFSTMIICYFTKMNLIKKTIKNNNNNPSMNWKW